MAAASSSEMAGVEKKLDVVIKLLGLIATRDMSRKDPILTLSQMGMPPLEVRVSSESPLTK